MTDSRQFWRTPLLIFVLAVPPIAVLTAYGWFPAFNFIIPLVNAMLWIGVLTLAAWGPGSFVFQKIHPSPQRGAEVFFFELVTGAGVLVATNAVLALLHILTPTPVLTTLALWASLGAVRAYRSLSGSGTFKIPEIHPLWFVIIAAAGISLAAATTFSAFHDQWNYHLAFPYQWLRAGTIRVFPRHAYSLFPANMGLLYVFGLAGAGGWAAQVIHWSMGALSAAGAALVAGRLGAPRFGRLLAAAVFLATPGAIQMGALAGADLGVASFATAAALAALRVRDDLDNRRRWSITAGFFAGLAVGCKYLALATVAVPVGVAVALTAFATSGRSSRLKASALAAIAFALAAACVAGPWFVRNAIATGNPTHPYFESVFRSPAGEDLGESRTVASSIGDFGLTTEKMRYALTLGIFSRRGHSGDLGPVYLSLAPLVFLWFWSNRRDINAIAVGVMIAGGIVLWAAGPPLGRYLLPTLVLLASCIGAAWSEIVGGATRIVRVAATTVLIAILIANCNPVRGEYLLDQLECFIGAADYDDYLAANSTQLDAIRAANEALPPDAVVLMVGETRLYGLDRDALVDDQFQTSRLVEIAHRSTTPAEMAESLHELGVTHILWNSAEADRIVAASGRDRFLQCEDPDSQTRLDSFLTDFTHPVERGAWWQILALGGS